MATISRPDEGISTSNAGISLDTARLAGRGTIQQGELLGSSASTIAANSNRILDTSLALSKSIDAQGQKLYNESKSAYQNSLLQNKMSEATTKFLEAKNARSQQMVDKDGNPTFQNLHKDISSIGDNIVKDMGNTIYDPEVYRAFKAKFGEYINSQKVSALKEGLQQELEYGRYSLQKNLKDLQNQALIDGVDQTKGYKERGLEAIDQALSSGLISFQQYGNLKESFGENIITGRIQKSIQTNPEEAIALLQNSSTELGISEASKLDLDNKLRVKLKSLDAERAKINQKQEIENLAEEANIIAVVENKIKADAITAEDLMQLKDKISTSSYNKLTKLYIDTTVQNERDNLELSDLGYKIVNQQSIDSVDTKVVDKFYNRLVEQAADQQGRNITLAEEAQLAVSIPREVPAYAKKLDFSTKYGDLSKAKDTVAAYSYIKDLKKPTLGNSFDSKSTAIMEHALMLVEKGGVSPEKALKDSRELVLNKDINVRTENLKAFNKESDFKTPDKLSEVAASNLPNAETWLGTNRINTEAVNDFRYFLREGYAELGNKDSAINYAVEMMSRNYGLSEVSGKKEYMFKPPEVITGVAPDKIRSELESEVISKGYVPQGSKLSLSGNSYSETMVTYKDEEGNKKYLPSWIITQEINGVQYPVTDKMTGKPLRWFSKPEVTKKEKSVELQQELDSLKEANRLYKEEMSKPSSEIQPGTKSSQIENVYSDQI